MQTKVKPSTSQFVHNWTIATTKKKQQKFNATFREIEFVGKNHTPIHGETICN